MPSQPVTLEYIFAEVQTLSPADKLRLVQRVIESLIPIVSEVSSQPIVYGRFKGTPMSTDEDFEIAETGRVHSAFFNGYAPEDEGLYEGEARG